MTQEISQTLMHKEAADAPARVRQQLLDNGETTRKLGEALRRAEITRVIFCARGSSSHAAVYARYLSETRLGISASFAAPSVSSIYGQQHDLRGVLFLAISQSGQSPDILIAAQAAKEGGAHIVALVNDVNSPLADIAHDVIAQHAGAERSVAATKTFICSLSAMAHLVAEWGQLDDVLAAFPALPEQLEAAFDIEWEEALTSLHDVSSLFVVSRGPGLGIAKEAALKFKETCQIHAEAFSAAEVKHGPMALVKDDFPVLFFTTEDAAQPAMDEVIKSFAERSARIFTTGRHYPNVHPLQSVTCDVAELRPLLTIQTFYRFVNALSVTRGLNPDRPDYLNKVTETL